jgi:hypothetical protein
MTRPAVCVFASPPAAGPAPARAAAHGSWRPQRAGAAAPRCARAFTRARAALKPAAPALALSRQRPAHPCSWAPHPLRPEHWRFRIPLYPARPGRGASSARAPRPRRRACPFARLARGRARRAGAPHLRPPSPVKHRSLLFLSPPTPLIASYRLSIYKRTAHARRGRGCARARGALPRPPPCSCLAPSGGPPAPAPHVNPCIRFFPSPQPAIAVALAPGGAPAKTRTHNQRARAALPRAPPRAPPGAPEKTLPPNPALGERAACRCAASTAPPGTRLKTRTPAGPSAGAAPRAPHVVALAIFLFFGWPPAAPAFPRPGSLHATAGPARLMGSPTSRRPGVCGPAAAARPPLRPKASTRQPALRRLQKRAAQSPPPRLCEPGPRHATSLQMAPGVRPCPEQPSYAIGPRLLGGKTPRPAVAGRTACAPAPLASPLPNTPCAHDHVAPNTLPCVTPPTRQKHRTALRPALRAPAPASRAGPRPGARGAPSCCAPPPSGPRTPAHGSRLPPQRRRAPPSTTPARF